MTLDEHLTAIGEPIEPVYECPISGRVEPAIGMIWVADDPEWPADFVSAVTYHMANSDPATLVPIGQPPA